MLGYPSANTSQFKSHCALWRVDNLTQITFSKSIIILTIYSYNFITEINIQNRFNRSVVNHKNRYFGSWVFKNTATEHIISYRSAHIIISKLIVSFKARKRWNTCGCMRTTPYTRTEFRKKWERCIVSRKFLQVISVLERSSRHSVSHSNAIPLQPLPKYHSFSHAWNAPLHFHFRNTFILLLMVKCWKVVFWWKFILNYIH